MKSNATYRLVDDQTGKVRFTAAHCRYYNADFCILLAEYPAAQTETLVCRRDSGSRACTLYIGNNAQLGMYEPVCSAHSEQEAMQKIEQIYYANGVLSKILEENP